MSKSVRIQKLCPDQVCQCLGHLRNLSIEIDNYLAEQLLRLSTFSQVRVFLSRIPKTFHSMLGVPPMDYYIVPEHALLEEKTESFHISQLVKPCKMKINTSLRCYLKDITSDYDVIYLTPHVINLHIQQGDFMQTSYYPAHSILNQ